MLTVIIIVAITLVALYVMLRPTAAASALRASRRSLTEP